MAATFFFYDLETSGVSAARQRIMQFAGQRTDLDLKPIGQPVNVLVKLSEDILPDPEAILVHGITPQRTVTEGLGEPEFLTLLHQQVFSNDTIMVGFNNIRFDDEFLRYTLWRNFHDPYEWQYKDNRSRWDLLDVVRMTRALRPDGIKWPVDDEGEPTNRLTALSSANGIKHANAHDALSDVLATIELAKLLKSAQPKLFGYLLAQRDKRSVAKTIGYDLDKKQITANQPFLYTSGRYPGVTGKTTAAIVIGPFPGDSNSVLVYDLRHDPRPFAQLSLSELTDRLFVTREEREAKPPLPVKKLSLNKSPAVAPLGTLDKPAQKRLNLALRQIQVNVDHLAKLDGFTQLVYDAFDNRQPRPANVDAESQLYDGFLNSKDKDLVRQVRSQPADKLADWHPAFIDERLEPLLLRYKARNYPSSLSDKESIMWESWRTDKLLNGVDGSVTMQQFGARLQNLDAITKDDGQRYLLEELQLYGESIAPAQLFDL